MENLLRLKFLFLKIYTVCVLMGITVRRRLVVQPLLFVTHGVESIAKLVHIVTKYFNLFRYFRPVRPVS
jgi:hypothetical protein